MDSILAAMLERVPDTYDKSEGSIFWDTLAPIAPEITRLAEAAAGILDRRLIDTATGDDLDAAVKEVGVTRKEAQYAKGSVTFTGTANTVISAGALVASEAAQFYTREDCTIGSSGPVDVHVVCTTPGEIGNVAVGAINRLPVTLSGVTSVTNAGATSGGTERETDDELRERTYLKIRSPGTSGNQHDYVNWALSVDGVGGAKCIPLWNGAGTVKVVITNASGETAPASLVTATKTYIETVRPVGASVTVVSATAKTINVKAKITFKSGYTITNVKAAIVAAITDYLRNFRLSGTAVSYARIGAIILGVDGVDDYSDLRTGTGTTWGTSNIAIATDEVPVMGDFTNVT